MSQHCLVVRDLKVHYPVRRGVFRRVVGAVKAVDGVDLAIRAGTTFGLVGESGCGKSSLSRAILRLQEPTAGRLVFHGESSGADLTALSPRALRALRRQFQIVFQDPYSALNPRLRILTILDEPLRAMEKLSCADRRRRIEETLALVGLPAESLQKYPHQFSGGQRQRIAIARALLSKPRLVVLDEPVSALDVSVRAQVLNLLADLQRRLGLTYLLVSHDLSVIRYVCDDVAVMYLGKIVESGPTSAVFANPRHPYTRLLLSAAPKPDPRRKRARILLQGDPPSPMNIPPGCAFHTRCGHATDRCKAETPTARAMAEHGHVAACHHAETLDGTAAATPPAREGVAALPASP